MKPAKTQNTEAAGLALNAPPSPMFLKKIKAAAQNIGRKAVLAVAVIGAFGATVNLNADDANSGRNNNQTRAKRAIPAKPTAGTNIGSGNNNRQDRNAARPAAPDASDRNTARPGQNNQNRPPARSNPQSDRVISPDTVTQPPQTNQRRPDNTQGNPQNNRDSRPPNAPGYRDTHRHHYDRLPQAYRPRMNHIPLAYWNLSRRDLDRFYSNNYRYNNRYLRDYLLDGFVSDSYFGVVLNFSKARLNIFFGDFARTSARDRNYFLGLHNRNVYFELNDYQRGYIRSLPRGYWNEALLICGTKAGRRNFFALGEHERIVYIALSPVERSRFMLMYPVQRRF